LFGCSKNKSKKIPVEEIFPLKKIFISVFPDRKTAWYQLLVIAAKKSADRGDIAIVVEVSSL